MQLRKLLKWALRLTPAGVALALWILCRLWPTMTESLFSRGVFRGLSAVLGTLTQYIPLSLTECLAVAAIPGLALLLVLMIRRRAGLGPFCAVLSALLLLYMLMHGLNYYRLPLSRQMGIEQGEPAAMDELEELCRYLAGRASAARESCREDDNGVMTLSAPLSDTLAAGGEGYAALAEDYPFLAGTVDRAKGVKLSHWWSYTGITGVYFPFLAEANVNIDQPDSELPMTVAHELAHTRGYAHEDECNFLGILACIAHPEADWQYSGWLSAYIYISNSLYGSSRDRWQRAAAVSEGVRRDLAARSAYWRQFNGPVQTASTAVNDAFIRVNGDGEGVARYDRVTALLIAWWRAGEFE